MTHWVGRDVMSVLCVSVGLRWASVGRADGQDGGRDWSTLRARLSVLPHGHFGEQLWVPVVGQPCSRGLSGWNWVLLELGAVVRVQACSHAGLAQAGRCRDTPYLCSSETQCSGHPDGFVTLPVGLGAHKPIKGLHR